MKPRCYCDSLPVNKADGKPAGRCNVCVDGILESKNETVREINRLRGMVQGLADRVAQQSELLSRRAEGKPRCHQCGTEAPRDAGDWLRRGDGTYECGACRTKKESS